jgi:hypothetical protein
MSGETLPVHVPKVITDGGPWAIHDQACAVCSTNAAVLDFNVGMYQPCWACQDQGFTLMFKPRRWFRRNPRPGDYCMSLTNTGTEAR